MKISPLFLILILLVTLTYADETVTQEYKYKTSEEIAANFNEIKDLTTETDKATAEKAIQNKYGVEVDLGKGGRIINGVLHSTYGNKDHVTLTNEDYKNGKLGINEGGIILFMPNIDQTSLVLPKSDSITLLVPKGQKLVLNYEEQEINIGEISMIQLINGQMYVDQIATINNVNFIYSKEHERLPIFFDDNEHIVPSITFNKENLFVKSDSEKIIVTLLEGNPFLDVKENNDVSFAITNTDLNLNSKEDLVNINTDRENGEFLLNNGKITFYVKNEKLATFFDETDKTSSSLRLRLNDEQGKNFIWKNPKDIIIGNNNQFFIVPFSEGSNFNIINSIFTVHQGKFTKKDINGVLVSRNNMDTIASALETLPNEMFDSVKGIVIHETKEFNKLEDQDGIYNSREVIAFVSNDNRIQLRADEVTEDVIYHESAHILANYIEGVYEKNLKEGETNSASLEERWKRGADPNNEIYSDTDWEERTGFPKDGFFSDYSTKNVDEDIAETFENVQTSLKNREGLEELKSTIKIDPLYSYKLYLLYKYKFISKEDYETLTGRKATGGQIDL